ncbi:MAG: glycosyltransferase family 2 protein [Fibrobacter sp.]|nr:glycosyltransferase family 2 protein [Fibrobacter sp.]
MQIPLISIIVPIYKVEPYLQRCLDSIVNQIYTNLEIILVDDGSPDNCPQICDKYAARDNRIVVIHKENGGLSDARNAGLNICKGEYISFIDSDDWVSLEYINELYSSIKETHADIAIVNHKHVTSFPAREIQEKRRIKPFSKQQALFKLIAEQHQPFVVSWGKLYRRELFSDIRFPIRKHHEDEFTSHLLINKAAKVAYSNRTMYFYYQRTDSITKQNHILDVIEAFENRLKFTINHNFKALIPYAASNLCWKYLNFCYEKYLNKEEYKQILNKTKEYRSLMRFRKATDFVLFIFLQHPKLYFFIKNRKC